MEIVVEKLLAAVRPLWGIRPAAWGVLVALTGFGLGLAMRSGLPERMIDLLIFAWVTVIAAAVLNMRMAERRTQRRRRQKLDALYGRRR